MATNFWDLKQIRRSNSTFSCDYQQTNVSLYKRQRLIQRLQTLFLSVVKI